MNTFLQITFIAATYLIGAIPVGYILTKYSTGKNIIEFGSGNIGSTNVKRIAGKKIALITQLLDMFKGLLPVLLTLILQPADDSISPYFVYFIALASIIGHDFSIFLKFRGGKGVNTTLGASVLLAPYAVFISVAVYFLVKWRFRFVSLGSLVLSVSLPVTDLIINGFTPTCFYLLVCMTLIIIQHRGNIHRLIHNQELPSS